MGCGIKSWTLPELPNMGAIGLRGVSAHVRNITVCDFLFFLFFVSSARLQVSTIEPIFTIYRPTVFQNEAPNFGSNFSHQIGCSVASYVRYGGMSTLHYALPQIRCIS